MDAHTHYHPAEEHDCWANEEAWEAQQSYEDGKWDFVSGEQPWDVREQVVDLYDGAIRQTDAAVGRIISWLTDAGRLDDTVVVITADHGETFGEPDDILPTRLSGHGFGMCEQLVHVPLVVWRPDRSGSERVDDPVSLTALSELPFNEGKIEDTQMPVIVTSDGLNGVNRTERAANYLNTSELDPFYGEIRVRYEVHAGRIRKHIAHADEYVSYEFNDGCSRVDAPTAERIDAVFGGLEDAKVAATDREVTNDTRSRLRDLGYI
jgi:arylsulfatase A-like enzyme